MTVRSRRSVIRPGGEPKMQFTLGYVASHGIVEALRWRSSEFSFATLPEEPFEIVLATSAGPQHYAVSTAARADVMNVCNAPNRIRHEDSKKTTRQ